MPGGRAQITLEGPGVVAEGAASRVPHPPRVRRRFVHIGLRHLELRVLGRSEKHQMPARHRKIRVHRITLAEADVPPPAPVDGVLLPDVVEAVGEDDRPLDRSFYRPSPLAADLPIHLPQHQGRDGMVVNRRVRRLLVLMHRPGRHQRDQSVRLLAGEHEINRPVQPLAVTPKTRLVPPGQERHDREARYGRLAGGQRLKRPVGSLLRRHPG